jgi:hypothetical protein
MNVELENGGFTEWGWIDFGLKTYYGLLNCGFRLRVTAGTASGVHPVQLGFGRVYVYLPNGFDYQAWMAGLDAGRSFVSTGPMLDVRFNQRPPGHVFHGGGDKPLAVQVAGEASSHVPLDRIELVVNGDVARTWEPANKPNHAGAYLSDIDERLVVSSSSWIAVRCFQRHPDGRVRFAHTNPVYVDITGKPLHPKQAEVEYFARRIRQEIERNRSVLEPASLAEYEQALRIYEGLVSQP